MRPWRRMHGSRCIWAKRKCGTAEGIVRQDAIISRMRPSEWTRTPEFDEVKDLQQNRGSEFWASRSVTSISWRPSSVAPPRSTEFCTNGSCKCRTFKVRGSCSCSVRIHEPRIPCGASYLPRRLSSQGHMTTRLLVCWGCHSALNVKIWPVSHLLQVVVVCILL